MTGHIARPGIDSHTVLYGVIGDPIRHSKSPIMMNRAFRETGINGAYAAFHITDDKLEDFIRGVRAMGIRGVNVTIPHKLRVMELLDEIHEGARAIGAVNTIVNDNGRLTGYNTDGIGYVRSLKEEAAPSIEGKRVVVIGAGGASRGIVYALLQEKPARITITNRTVQRAEELAASLEAGGVQLDASSNDQLEELCGEADIVINTTSVGMFPQVDQSPVPGHWLKPGSVASDLIYNPLKTRFLLEAEQQGCIAHGGLGMFIYQGAYAFEYWTGQPAPVAAMREEVLAALQ
ncbi:shikimate dehydrogenase [Paenibacillus sp. NPDC057967]|uniref:shikimate dehydrogenase n=1 Tax=Paenibacillus sp. NPDC057967 TaxID=3346293 RepID=UPI0036DF81D6